MTVAVNVDRGCASVVIPVKDDERLYPCIESVLAAGARDVIVVENGSQPEFAAELARRLPAGVRLLRIEEAGVYNARNAGIDEAAGTVVFFTDADCLVDPGWLDAGLCAIAEGADIVQGYSGAISRERTARWLQARYAAHLRKLRRGDPTETDTRNMAVRRAVFERLRFNGAYRRVGDTEFGLLAEAAGFRVAYEPGMRVQHEHDDDLRVFAAKQVCHGWGAQRLMQQHPEVEWHGGHLKLVARVSHRVSSASWLRPLAGWFMWMAVTVANGIQRAPRWLPDPVAISLLTLVDKAAALGGHLSYRPGEPEPSPSGVLGWRLPRD